MDNEKDETDETNKIDYERSIIISTDSKLMKDGIECCEVLINNCYGGFRIPYEVRDAIFALYPPHTEIGKLLFRKASYPVYESENDAPPDVKQYILLSHYTDYVAGYKIVNGYYISDTFKDLNRKSSLEFVEKYYKQVKGPDGNFYSLSIDTCSYGRRIWREHKDVIRLCKELEFIEKQFGHTELKITNIPIDRKYYISEYDGMESIRLIPLTEIIIKDLLQIIRTGNQKNIHKVTQLILNDEIDIDKATSKYYY